MKFQPRDYQQAAINGVAQKITEGHKRILLCLCTGAGKSTVFSMITKRANAKGSRTLFMVHNKELVTQAADRLRNQLHVSCGIIMAGVNPMPQELNQIASVQSLVRRKKPEADIVFIDEAHRAKASTYEKILAEYPNAIIIGLTATPFRTDGKGLGDIFTAIVHPVKIKELISRGFLVGTKTFIPVESVATEGLKMMAGDYDKKQLAGLFEDATLVDGVVRNYVRIANGKKAIAFHVNVEISKRVNEEFARAGISSAHLDGTTPKAERERVNKLFAAGEIMVLNNCNLFREGYDVPDTECVIMNTATKSLGMFVQCVGRGLRPAPGKDHCIVIDHGNNTLEHGYAEDYDIGHFHLSPTEKKDSLGIPKVKTCPECRSVVERFEGRCESCDYLFETEERVVKTAKTEGFVVAGRDAVIMGMVENMNPKKKRIPPYLLRMVCAYKGYKRSWSAFRAIEMGYVKESMNHPRFWQIVDKELSMAELSAGVSHLVEKMTAA